MLGEIATGISSLQAAASIVKGLNAANTQALINDVKLGLQGHILEAQAALMKAQETHASLLRRINDLEQEIVHLKDWEADKQRYELKAVDTGVFAYMPKSGMGDSEPPHWLCPNCFSRKQKSFLQFKGRDTRSHGSGRGDHSNYGCDTCKAAMKVFYMRNPGTPWPPVAAANPTVAAEQCPKCGKSAFALEKSIPHPTFSEVGLKLDTMKCGACAFSEDRTRDP